MSTNNTQPGHSPSESFIQNKGNQSNMDQLLCDEIVTTSQPLSSSSLSTQFNPLNMIANIEQHNNVLTRQLAQRGRQHQQRQEEQRRLREEQQQQQRERQRRRRERRERRYEQWRDRVYQRQWERYREELEEQDHYAYLQRRSPTFDELMDEILEERQLEVYYLERMTPQERQEIWEQQHLNELQENPAPRPHGLPPDDLEQYAIFQEQQLRNDQLEQTMEIDEMERWERIQEYHRNAEDLIQKKQWEQLAFYHQQQLQ